jgi:hypothetical protein
MSTRGCVAVGSSSIWKGIYNNHDSYPTGLGAEVYKLAKEQAFTGTLRVWCEGILKAGRWENFVSGLAIPPILSLTPCHGQTDQHRMGLCD